jgi:hypothetical protein
MFHISQQYRLRTTHRLLKRGRCVSFGIMISLLSVPLLLAAAFPITGDPAPPLSRNSPRKYTLTIRVEPSNKKSLGWPYVEKTNFNILNATSFRVTNQVNDDLPYSYELLKGRAEQWHVLINSDNYQIHFTEMAYASKLDDEAASLIAWNDDWAEEVSFYLQPSLYLRSNDAIFSTIVTNIIDKQKMTPHIAAKKIIRYCLQNTNSNGLFANNKGRVTTGLIVRGAKYALTSKAQVSATDELCSCIATLRAAGIPARPIIGITTVNAFGKRLSQPSFVVWGEYALAGSGWVPFNAKRMRNTVNNLKLTEPWDALGTWETLNRHIPIAINFELFDAKNSTQELQMKFISSPSEE